MTDTHQRVDVDCPPNPSAECVCGDELQDHYGDGDLCVPHIKADVPRTFQAIDGDQVECRWAMACEECGYRICSEHSNEFTTCAENPLRLHHLDCRDECQACVRALAEDSAADLALDIARGY